MLFRPIEIEFIGKEGCDDGSSTKMPHKAFREYDQESR